MVVALNLAGVELLRLGVPAHEDVTSDTGDVVSGGKPSRVSTCVRKGWPEKRLLY